ncbi:MAG: LPS export ABC transporter permease LptG [Pseudomonadota bacterium]|jgi:lipopolysaccharide export system permease protein|uniref:LPS export ABC transporter permease LptG n=1 Tax=Rhodanobacter sp. OK091 TaxID=1881037 RepID=UPI00091A4183|nr:LPS export ABC transporter permease LptG [Rhodanobacter sp. OK091]SHM40201.1 lipopolysaccharide export system permease protein [Rhodanobacter sp. OK091]
MSVFNIKRVDRLVAMSVLGSLLMVWLVLTGFDAVTQFLRQLGSVGKHGYTLSNAVVYVLVTFPRRAYEMFGNAALIGGLLGLGGLAGTGELTALRAAGMSRLRIAGSAVGVVAVLIVGVVILGETAAPWGDQQAQTMQLRMKSADLGMGTNSGLWARDGNSFINARGTSLKRHDGLSTVQLSDVRVFTFTDDGQLSRFEWAKTAEHDGRQWILRDVRSTTLDVQGTHTTLLASQPWQSSLNPQVLAQSVIQPQYLSMRDLRRNMHYLESNGESPGSYAVAFWGRALYPLNVLVLVLCAMPFAFGTLRSGGLGKRMFIGMLLAIGWYFLQQAMVNFGTVYGMPPLLANLLPASILALAAWLYFRRSA